MKRYFIHTFGCQMNVNDSLRMGEALARASYGPAPSPEDADLIVLNTCAIREKAEDKMLSALGRYRSLKASRGTLLGVGGCVAQQEKDRLLKRVPYLDFVFGPDNIGKLPEILERIERDRVRVVETAWVESEEYLFPRADPQTSAGKVTEFVTVMKGCDNVCSFCVVPHTRGREVSRPFPEVLREVADLAQVGVREVTLIGQNVNSYRGGLSFAQLLLRTAEVPGILRVRFTTSHPHDLSDELVDAFAAQPKIAPHFHLPVQCGSDRILKKMRRDYTVAEYLERLGKLRAARPGIAVTTDIIVGFPGETEEDFQGTLDLTAHARFEGQFSFVFSPRPKTAAGSHEDEWGRVPHEVKVERLERVQALQRRISSELMSAHVGATVQVLVEGPSKQDPERRFGRTPENRTVNFDGDASAGAVVPVLVRSSTPAALLGGAARMSVRAFQGVAPKIHATCYIEQSAQIIGDVEIGEQSSVWFNTVIRGDVNTIRIGKRTNIQDLSLIHVLKDRHATAIGDEVTVGHHVVLHGCTVGNRVLVGMSAVLMDGVVVEDDCVIAAGALLTPGTRVPTGMLAVGSPAKPKRPLTPEEREWLSRSAANYVEYAVAYMGS